MSSRDNSFMYTGINSVSSEVKTLRETQREAKEQDHIKLRPAADVVLDLIAKERNAVTDIRSLVIDRTSTEIEVNTELLARKLYLGHLNSLETKIKSIMAVKPVKKRREDDDE